MYPNSAISAGEMIIIAVVMVACLSAWIASVYIAARPSQRDRSAAATPLGTHPPVADAGTEAPERKAA